MGHHPSSRFGFGVMIDGAAVSFDREPSEGSPSFLLQNGEPDSTGISLHDTGDSDGPYFLLIHESVSVSPDWMGAVIPPAETTTNEPGKLQVTVIDSGEPIPTGMTAELWATTRLTRDRFLEELGAPGAPSSTWSRPSPRSDRTSPLGSLRKIYAHAGISP